MQQVVIQVLSVGLPAVSRVQTVAQPLVDLHQLLVMCTELPILTQVHDMQLPWLGVLQLRS